MKQPDRFECLTNHIAMTANAFEEDKEKAFESGMNGHLAKPIKIPELLKTLNQVLRKEK